MKTKEKIHVTGALRVRLFDINNKLVFEDISKNLVVDSGLAGISELLGGTGKPVDNAQVGTGTTAVDTSDINLQIPTGGNYPMDSVNYSTGAGITVEFNFSLNYADENGLSITEYGLFNEDNILYARIVKPAILKDVSYRLEGQWTIQFTNS